MNFNSSAFACFALIVGVLYVCLRRTESPKLQNSMLLVASYVFYGSWDYRFLYLILFSTALDFICGLAIQGFIFPKKTFVLTAFFLGSAACLLCSPINYVELYGSLTPRSVVAGGWKSEANLAPDLSDHATLTFVSSLIASVAMPGLCYLGRRVPLERRRKYFLLLSICGNLGLLGLFKYFDFFVSTFEQLLNRFGLNVPYWQLGIVIPVGISFYTFQTLSYTIDVYRKELKPTRNLVNFALFVSFFPQLVAGPIERARVLLPQLERTRVVNLTMIRAGAFLIFWGLFKKIFVADNLAPIVNAEFANDIHTGASVLLATYAFAFQIFADFSAYSDIARGLSRCMGIELMVNFNIPFASKSPSEFWRRGTSVLALGYATTSTYRWEAIEGTHFLFLET